MNKHRDERDQKGWSKRIRASAAPTLRFLPSAWAKLLFLRDYGDTEVGGFGISAAYDLLLIEDVQLVRQTCSLARVAFDDESVADFFDQQVDLGRTPQQFGRIWLHTHPGDCPRPSATDEQTFDQAFGRADWAVMFILAFEGEWYARLRFNVGPLADVQIPVHVDYAHPFPASDHDAWEQEYLANVQPQQPIRGAASALDSALVPNLGEEPNEAWYESWYQYAADEEESEDLIG